MLKIEDKLYYYNYSSGITNTASVKQQYKTWFTVGDVVKKIGAYAHKHSVNIYFEKINLQHCISAIAKWLSVVDEEDLVPYLDKIKSQYGFNTLLHGLLERFSGNISYLAWKFSSYFDYRMLDKKVINNIVLFIFGRMNTASEIRLETYYNTLIKLGYNVDIIVSGDENDTECFPRDAAIYHISQITNASVEERRRYLDSLENIIKEHGFDLAIYINDPDPSVFWDFLIWDHYRIPVLVFYEIIATRYIAGNMQKKYQALDAVLKCASAIITSSLFAQAIARSISLDSHYLPAVVLADKPHEWTTAPRQCIAVYFDAEPETYQLGQSLLILKDVIAECPWMRMIVIGTFRKAEERNKFFETIRKLDLVEHVHLTNRSDNYDFFFKQCGIYLSTAYTHAGLLPIDIAQSFGLPSVIYDIPSDSSYDDKGIDVCGQYDVHGAARQIIHLFQSREYWTLQSNRARKSHENTVLLFENSLQSLLRNLGNSSIIQDNTYRDMRQFINYAADYAMQPGPSLV